MSHSFADLKKSRTSSFEKLNSELNKLNEKSQSSNDDRFWSPTVGKDGNGYAVIRFLPAPSGEDVPFIRRWDHGFKGVGGWYINMSLNTIGKDDPVSDLNRKLWAQGEGSEGRRIVSGHGKDQPGSKRRLHYISNIYIVDDPDHPENNGKVKLYKYGMKIFDKLNDLMSPKFKDETPTNPFDLWEGATFKIKIRNVEGYRNYDKSEFMAPAPLLDDDAKLEEIWKSEYSLQEFLDPKNFKSYEELERQLTKVLGLDTKSTAERAVREDIAEQSQAPKQERAAPAKQEPEAGPEEGAVSGDDEGLAFFQKLAQGSKS